MKKKTVKILRYAATFAVSAAVGLGGSFVWRMAAHPSGAPAQPEPAAQGTVESVQIRVHGGVTEWFDGTRWNAVGTLEELEQSDPTAVKTDTWQLVAQQRAAAKEQQRQSALTQLSRTENSLAVGEKPVTQTTRPATTTPTTTTPAQPTQPSGGSVPDPTPTPPQTSDPVPSGDGENLDGGALFG